MHGANVAAFGGAAFVMGGGPSDLYDDHDVVQVEKKCKSTSQQSTYKDVSSLTINRSTHHLAFCKRINGNFTTVLRYGADMAGVVIRWNEEWWFVAHRVDGC